MHRGPSCHSISLRVFMSRPSRTSRNFAHCTANLRPGHVQQSWASPLTGRWIFAAAKYHWSSCLPNTDVAYRSPDPRVYASHWNTTWLGTAFGRPPRRRKKLPEPAEPTKKLNIWSLIKDFVGKDINHLSVPVHISEPICELQRRAEGFECSYLLDQVCLVPLDSK